MKEFGEKWHKAGMLENKQNVFDDFLTAAEWLIENKYTNRSKLAIMGGSNGGLLVGAALTQRPDLFKAVVCTYPLLDMIRFHKFMLAKFWVSEYGSSEDPDQFKYIYAYSPYHNVKKGAKYPATMFITGDSDTRVAPLHARKMTALLQSSNVSDNPILLLYDTKAGHSGGRPLSKQIEDETDEMSFLFWQLGMTIGEGH
jgi:prolyl oligopeptidase